MSRVIFSGAMSERRDSARYPTAWTGRLGDRRTSMRVVDASEDGIFLAMSPVPTLGTNLIIEVVVDGQPHIVAGAVVRIIPANPETGTPSGVGLKLFRKPHKWEEMVAQLADGSA
ncbi:MAG: PilZ domain-containing protein [Deltaproteobacteria bacterium]|nr:PilZ domain-containing protein [Deltaproteobacteria bacterium]